ncbi:hypothetical protein V8E55_010449 [Tylopilus felleus]
MDYINKAFTNGMLNNQKLSPAICVAIGLAKKTLNRYYSLMDLGKMYCIAMVLHPCHKLKYFKSAS